MTTKNTKKRLIFFTNSDPAVTPERIETAYHFANIAAQAGVRSEVRLAGDAVKVALPEAIAEGHILREKVANGPHAPFDISF